MLVQLLVAVGLTIGLVTVWVAVQALVRRNSPEFASGADGLACRVCAADGNCSCGLKKYISEGGKTVETQGVER